MPPFSNSSSFAILGLCALVALSIHAQAQESEENLSVPGLDREVEIIRDRFGISHIYAENQRDLFFAQGFSVARDRLFQLELWRRQATGTASELLGRSALQQDTGARLLRARVDMKEEMRHYHPDGEEIITSFVRGINAFIDLTRSDPELLPPEFEWLDIAPGHWTPEVVVSRHNGLYRNAGSEIRMAQRVQAAGGALVIAQSGFQPSIESLEIPQGLDPSGFSNQVMALHRGSRARVRFGPEHILPRFRRQGEIPPVPNAEVLAGEELFEGSNNWVVSGSRTFSRMPIMANDPHRSQQIPSLRYWVHLVAPGWNVIGAGEPALPGVSVGHNEHGAWGLTIFGIDQEDLYVYETNPANPDQYRYLDQWEDMRILRDEIAIKGEPSEQVELKYTRHGPVLFEDLENNQAYALRAAWLEVGGAPYLASLRMDQAKSWEEFREACRFSHTPSENMVWADVEGNIGWQAVGIAPIRHNWYGLMPVPGDGRYEWDGFVPIRELPHVFNPQEGYFATANEFNLPDDYPHRLGYSWSSPFRVRRIQEVLASGRNLTVLDNMQLQHDELSLPARFMVPLLKGGSFTDPRTAKAAELLLAWDFVMAQDSPAAAIFSNWRGQVSSAVGGLQGGTGRVSATGLSGLLAAPDGRFGEAPVAGRDQVLAESLSRSVEALSRIFGDDMSSWRHGDVLQHHIRLRHPLARLVNAELAAELNPPPKPRGGTGNTVNQTGSGQNQTSGASFRIVADTANWDHSVGTNNPGQSGDYQSPHYSDLYELWGAGKYFPVLYSRDKVESAAEHRTLLRRR